MKEVTYKDWQKNPTPRMMWVWNDNDTLKVKRKVVYFYGVKDPYPIVTLTADESVSGIYMHCAEIEEPRRMTNKELSRWLREGSRREAKCTINSCVYSAYFYKESKASEEVDSRILIREDDGEWREPLVEE